MLLPWKVQTGRLLEEIGKNPEAAVLRQPLRIFADLLAQVGARCAEIDDPVLNGLMCQLAIYGVADPDDSGFDQAKTERLIADKERITREHRHPAIRRAGTAGRAENKRGARPSPLRRRR